MDIEALRSFIAFVDTGSFTRAAKQVCRTQGAVSMQMKKLEEEAGQVLFRKNGRYLTLTDQGQSLVSYARRIVGMHDEVLGSLASHAVHPPIRIGCPDDYAESVLPQLTELLIQQLPQQCLRIHCDCSTQLRLMLDNGEIDIAILTRAPEKEEGYLLKHDSGVWVHGGYPALLEKQILPLVMYEADCKFHSSAIDGLEKQGKNYHLVCTTSSATAIKSLIKRGVGISAMARSSVSPGLLVVDQAAKLPELPAVDIVLAVAPIPHPMMGAAMAAKLCAEFRENSDN
ncbi:LysR substrate-binding domain-containing protein [Neptunomonas qingdaonensis]|uniref:DNA-binding transcriptional regulator, LysR family n=1 Tax=Neptunomonas qingdaonensis TaxID=1045558 RepID=A0A1I2S7F0_9GAMM|nr:LysR substrate-binding domain-containing protein [Neptunomonas qingdaonensis]SFG46807.1 DNA-binding transcriptional regulator, LysR family [Neptunomonas qingdaonensis]